ncbi:MAG: YCII-related domain protein [Myxococcaceae bacterium]|nr:YCII-related domain protein [Myxococcaceae bacterium]
MLYAILCYDSEDAVCAWTKEEDDAALAKLAVVQDKLARQGRLGPVARLQPTKSATTVRKGKEPLVVDGPFAETKEQLLGFFIVECATLEDALDAARDFARASSSHGAYEVRPLAIFHPGTASANASP